MKRTVLLLSLCAFASIVFSQWTNQSSGVTNDLNDVFFTGNTTGWAVGRQGTLLTTTNAGSTWTAQNSGTNEDLNAVFMVSASVGYAVGDEGKISKYNGTTWAPANTSETRDVFGVYFIDANTGWAVGDWGRLYHTSNGGSSWTNQNTDPLASYLYHDVHMLSGTDGWAVGTSGRIARYNGANWSGQTSGVSEDLLGVHFLNASFGFAVGKSSTILFYDGSSWTPHNSGLGNTSDNIYDVHIVSQNEAYAMVSPGFGGAGIILKFNGSTWSKDYEFTGLGTELFYGVHFPSASKGYAVGAGGMIKSKGTVTSIDQVSAHAAISIYPNPCNGKFWLDARLVKGSLAVFNTKGEKVLETTLEPNTSKHVDISSFPKGIYSVRVTHGRTSFSRKVVVQ
jgi:photosystem II stability/assembly factor-like uncharacterized protein